MVIGEFKVVFALKKVIIIIFGKIFINKFWASFLVSFTFSPKLVATRMQEFLKCKKSKGMLNAD